MALSSFDQGFRFPWDWGLRLVDSTRQINAAYQTAEKLKSHHKGGSGLSKQRRIKGGICNPHIWGAYKDRVRNHAHTNHGVVSSNQTLVWQHHRQHHRQQPTTLATIPSVLILGEKFSKIYRTIFLVEMSKMAITRSLSCCRNEGLVDRLLSQMPWQYQWQQTQDYRYPMVLGTVRKGLISYGESWNGRFRVSRNTT
jgi:hypothetical protein